MITRYFFFKIKSDQDMNDSDRPVFHPLSPHPDDLKGDTASCSYDDLLPSASDEKEQYYVTIVSALLELTLARKPSDPLDSILNDILCFPFANEVPDFTTSNHSPRLVGFQFARPQPTVDNAIGCPTGTVHIEHALSPRPIPPIKRRTAVDGCSHCASVRLNFLAVLYTVGKLYRWIVAIQSFC